MHKVLYLERFAGLRRKAIKDAIGELIYIVIDIIY